ncbi:hypothetical protein Q7P37_008051 [Cladosporium fusiforme]
MDPQSQAFTPYSSNNETWRLQSDILRVQQLQAEHAERIARLERRQDDDARMKSVWGQSSPFPSVLSGTPQQTPYQQPPTDQFRNFDDEANNLMSSLHLDAEEEPRSRAAGAASRANSVRFDETANQNHFSHSSRPSMDYLPRAGSGLGGLSMNERTTSHKSEGRASSVHSMRSAASGRANSLNFETTYGMGDASRSPLDTPALAPGLLLLGSVPAIIRCWMNTNFKHNALLYAAVCTGSYKSYLDIRLIQNLGFEDDIVRDADGAPTVELPVYFPEAVPHPTSSRSSSPAPQLPTLTVNFQVVDASSYEGDTKAIQIFIGSDTLRAHSADVLLSSNSLTLFDDERSKLSIPLVRPENEASFKSLYVSSGDPFSSYQPKAETKQNPYLNGLGQGSSGASATSAAASPPPSLKYRPPTTLTADSANAEPVRPGASSDTASRPVSRQSGISRPLLNPINTQPDAQASQVDAPAQVSTQTPPQRSVNSPAISSNWRRDAPQTSSSAAATPTSTLDWANAGKPRPDAVVTSAAYQRKDTGIKVLKPKSATRTFSGTSTASPSATLADGRSRFFDEGMRRSGSGPDAKGAEGDRKDLTSSSPAASGGVTQPKTRSNPAGGASAFSWLNSGGLGK